jgi:hypothetical protein
VPASGTRTLAKTVTGGRPGDVCRRPEPATAGRAHPALLQRRIPSSLLPTEDVRRQANIRVGGSVGAREAKGRTKSGPPDARGRTRVRRTSTSGARPRPLCSVGDRQVGKKQAPSGESDGACFAHLKRGVALGYLQSARIEPQIAKIDLIAVLELLELA